MAAAVGAGISMGFAEALSDDGSLTGRGRPLLRGLICGVMTFLGGVGHALPFLIPNFVTATVVATIVVAIELLAIAWIRNRYMDTPFLAAAFQVVVGGVLGLPERNPHRLRLTGLQAEAALRRGRDSEGRIVRVKGSRQVADPADAGRGGQLAALRDQAPLDSRYLLDQRQSVAHPQEERRGREAACDRGARRDDRDRGDTARRAPGRGVEDVVVADAVLEETPLVVS